jgi:hypothetical protein
LKVKKEVAMAITEKHTKGTPVSSMTLADLNRRNQQTYTADAPYAEELRRGMDPKADQLRPGTTVHNSRGLTGKVVRVEGNRVVVRCPDGSQDQWDLRMTHEYAGDEAVASGPDGSKPSPLETTAMPGEPSETPAQDSEGTEALREGVEEFLAEEEAEPDHQTEDVIVKRPWSKEDERLYNEQVLKSPNTDIYQRQRAELYMSQHPGTSFEEALKVVNQR